jgi:hypothetical protein
MVWETLGVVVSGIATYWGTVGGGLSYLLSIDILSNKSTEKINSMKSFKDSSVLKKALYVSHPGIYWALGNEKEKRNKLDNEFRKKYGMKTLEEELEEKKQEMRDARTTVG